MARDVRVAILGDSRDFSRAVTAANRDADRLHGSFSKAGSGIKNLAKGAAIGVAGLGVLGVSLAKGFLEEAVEAQKVGKQTAAVIKSMGGASKVSAKQVADLAEKLSVKAGIDDELIQSGQNVLLTFGKIRNEVGKGNKIFDRATEAALDMSVALGTDLKAANIQIGKALNDPLKGITALTRAGVSFTQQQKDQIKALVASGKTLEAQKIILGELEKQFGGSAAAQATAGDRLKVVWGNLQEDLGKRLLPIFEKVAEWASVMLPKALDAISEWWDDNGPGITDAFESFGEAAGKVLGELRDWIEVTALPALNRFKDWFVNNEFAIIAVLSAVAAAFLVWAVNAGIAAAATIAATWPILAIIAVLALLAAGLIYAYTHWDWFRKAVDAVARSFGPLLSGFFGVIAWIWNLIVAVNTAIDSLGRLASAIKNVATLGMGGVVSSATGGGSGAGITSYLRRHNDDEHARGGMVAGGLGQPRRIIAHGGERVLTHGEQLRGGGTWGGGDTIVIPVSIGGREIERLIVDTQARTVRRGYAA